MKFRVREASITKIVCDNRRGPAVSIEPIRENYTHREHYSLIYDASESKGDMEGDYLNILF